ncbi:MAG: MBL fold metallo-hydrolase [Planctomycetota bacterium]|nr:MAG: MBL fold metallo-hydrolase [Planctomycetota bacterium]
MLEVHEIPVTPFQQNATLWVCRETGEALVCDAGDAGPILAKIEALGVTVGKIIATHGHIDHVAGTAELKRALGVEFWFPPGDDGWLQAMPKQAMSFGLPVPEIPVYEHEIHEGQAMELGKVKLEVFHCPGHTPGHVVFHQPEQRVLIAGDILFAGSIGRTDFPGGSFEELERSIQDKLYVLPGDTVVHCGHGPVTEIGREARSNPFVRAKV